MIVAAAWKKILSAAPFLNLPVIGPIAGFIFEKIAARIYDELDLHITYLYIDFKSESEKNKLDAAILAFKNSKPEDKENAAKNLESALSNLITFSRR